MKKWFMECPYCANEIKEGAVKCQYCHEFLDWKEEKKVPQSSKKTPNNKFLVILIITLWVLLLWICVLYILNNKHSKEDKNNNIKTDDIFKEIDDTKNSSEESTQLWWTTYDNWEITFQYPEGLRVSESDFWSFDYFNWININIKKYNYDSYLDEIAGDYWIWAMELSEKELNDYKKQKKIQNIDVLTSVKNWTRKWEKLCTYWCSVTAGVIWSKKISINWVNWILNNYYFTQDPWLACFTQINTEVLLVKDENTIYSIMFKYNFGDAYTFMYPYKTTSSSEICIYDVYRSLASSWNDDIEWFFGYKISSLQWKDVAPFEKTYNKIIEIAKTINFK